MADLAKYSIDIRIEGMKIPGQKEGVGDRSLRFEAPMDPEDFEMSNEIWYGHLRALLGPDEMDKIAKVADDIAKRR